MSVDELLHILVSVITISIAFTIVSTGNFSPSSQFVSKLGTIILTVGAGFVLHELAHKYVAIGYGAHARYTAWTLGLVVAIIMAFTLGFVFAAPGAVYIYGHNLDREKNGKIALAGPLTNLILGLFFLVLLYVLPGLSEIWATGMGVNFFLGLFNMIPTFPFDGQKVYIWNKLVWATIAIVLLIPILIFKII